ARVMDEAGNVLDRLVTWASRDTAKATVTNTGLVSGRSPGAVAISATSEGSVDSATVVVSQVPEAMVIVSPEAGKVTVGATLQLSAEVRDASGNPLSGRKLEWS